MADTNRELNEELLEAFYLVITDFRLGLTDEVTFTEKIFRIAERYERIQSKLPAKNRRICFDYSP